MNEILNLIESVSEGFPSYFCITLKCAHLPRCSLTHDIYHIYLYEFCFVDAKIGKETGKAISFPDNSNSVPSWIESDGTTVYVSEETLKGRLGILHISLMI